MPDALTLLESRRTVSSISLGAPGPSDEQIETLIRIASRVPDHGKLTPWRFILYSGAARARAGEGLAAILASRDPATSPDRLEQERQRFTRVPLTIGVVSRAKPHFKIPEWEQVLSAGAATMNLVLAAHALGFSAQWLTEWVAYDAEAGAFLGLNEGERFAGLVVVGTPNVPPVDRPRPSFTDTVTVWGA
ncbi:MAG: nitroreductase [Ancalomicrobiaceae bacterium]|nr:nitroreductase [Ancalomicrobiaceae bacterium]